METGLQRWAEAGTGPRGRRQLGAERKNWYLCACVTSLKMEELSPAVQSAQASSEHLPGGGGHSKVPRGPPRLWGLLAQQPEDRK